MIISSQIRSWSGGQGEGFLFGRRIRLLCIVLWWIMYLIIGHGNTILNKDTQLKKFIVFCLKKCKRAVCLLRSSFVTKQCRLKSHFLHGEFWIRGLWLRTIWSARGFLHTGSFLCRRGFGKEEIINHLFFIVHFLDAFGLHCWIVRGFLVIPIDTCTHAMQLGGHNFFRMDIHHCLQVVWLVCI